MRKANGRRHRRRTERLDVEARRDFWKAAHERLSTYVPDGDRSRIETSLARRVPPLTAAEEAAWRVAVSQEQLIETSNANSGPCQRPRKAETTFQ
jgi:hypothetical protein